MGTYSRALLSASTNGRGVKVAATAIGSGTVVHTATAVSGAFDEIYLWASNSDVVDRFLTIGWGGTSSPDDLITPLIRIPAGSGPIPVVMGQVLNGGLVVKVSADAANVISIFGQVNHIAP